VSQSHPFQKILIVDDAPSVADMLALFFKLEGLDAVVAYNGTQAIEKTAEFLPDIVFMDIGMPDIDGYEAARRIRESSHGQQVTLVALTGWGDEKDRLKAHENGFDHHLVKPVDPQRLRSFLTETPPRPT
jgi:DNA-binding response OmpR family regulator